MTSLIMIVVSSALVSNVVLEPVPWNLLIPWVYPGRLRHQPALERAVIFVITIASAVASLLYDYVLAPLNLDYLKTIVFILVIAALVQLVEMFLKKTSRAIYEALGIYLPLITTNCAVLGVALTNVQNGYNLLESVLCGFGTAHWLYHRYRTSGRYQRHDWMRKQFRHRSAELRSCFCAQL